MKIFFTTLLFGCFFAINSASAQTTAPAPLDSTTVKEFLGTYDTGGMGLIRVTWENNQMMGELEGQGKAALFPTSTADVFGIDGMDGTVTFFRNEEKKVIRLQIDVQGQVIVANKQQ